MGNIMQQKYPQFTLISDQKNRRFGQVSIWGKENLMILQKQFFFSDVYEKQDFLKQCHSSKNLKHSSLLQMLNYEEEDDENISIFIEYYDSNLAKEIIQRGIQQINFTQNEIWLILENLISVGAYLQGQGIYHGDLKSSNIMLDDEGVPKIADYGLIHPIKSGPIKTLHILDKTYLSPELLDAVRNKQSHPKIDYYKNDVFTLGMTLLEATALTSMQICYNWNLVQLNTNILNEFQNQIGQNYSQALQNIIKIMTDVNPYVRPDFITLKKQFFQQQTEMTQMKSYPLQNKNLFGPYNNLSQGPLQKSLPTCLTAKPNNNGMSNYVHQQSPYLITQQIPQQIPQYNQTIQQIPYQLQQSIIIQRDQRQSYRQQSPMRQVDQKQFFQPQQLIIQGRQSSPANQSFQIQRSLSQNPNMTQTRINFGAQMNRTPSIHMNHSPSIHFNHSPSVIQRSPTLIQRSPTVNLRNSNLIQRSPMGNVMMRPYDNIVTTKNKKNIYCSFGDLQSQLDQKIPYKPFVGNPKTPDLQLPNPSYIMSTYDQTFNQILSSHTLEKDITIKDTYVTDLSSEHSNYVTNRLSEDLDDRINKAIAQTQSTILRSSQINKFKVGQIINEDIMEQ